MALLELCTVHVECRHCFHKEARSLSKVNLKPINLSKVGCNNCGKYYLRETLGKSVEELVSNLLSGGGPNCLTLKTPKQIQR